MLKTSVKTIRAGILFFLLMTQVCLAETVSVAPLKVQTEVTPSIELSYIIFQGAPTDDVKVDNVNFEVLKDRFPGDKASRGSLFSDKWYTVMVFVGVSGGLQYEVTQAASPLTSGTAEIPSNAYLCTPVYAEDDEWHWWGANGELYRKVQGPQPAGSLLHSAGSAVETNKKIYTSEVKGSSRIIQIVYALTNGYKADGGIWPGFVGEGIPLDQPSGVYSGTITITVTTL